MKITGKVTGILTNIETGEKRVAFEETNHLQDYTLSLISDAWTQGTSNRIGKTIGIIHGDLKPAGQRRDWTLKPNHTISGTDIPGITNPEFVFYDDVDDVHAKIISQTFSPPLSGTRSTNVICILGGTSTDIVQAAVTLSTPCVQGTLDTLDIIYRIQLAYDPDFFTTAWAFDSPEPTPAELQAWCRWVLNEEGNTNPANSCYSSWCDKMNTKLLKSCIQIKNGLISTSVTYPTAQPEYFKVSQLHTLPISNSVGRLIASTWFYRSGLSYILNLIGANKILSGTNESPIQNTFGHSSAATTPFYDAATVQTGTGELSIGGTWTNPDYPKLLKLEMVTSGATGVSEYKYRYRNMLGFKENTYVNLVTELPGYGWANDHFSEGFQIIRGHPLQVTDTDETRRVAPMIEYSDKEFVSGWIDEILISNILTQKGKRFAADTTPALSVVDVTQFCKNPSNGDVWVACTVNGAFKIAADQLTVTRSYNLTTGLTGTTGCYGVAVTNSGRVWAFFGGTNYGLYYSDDDGTSWTSTTFSHAAIDADPTLVSQIEVDPSHANDHIGILYFDSVVVSDSRALNVAWWDLAGIVAVGGAAVTGPIVIDVADYLGGFNAQQSDGGATFWADYSTPITLMKALRCSPNDNFWIAPFRRTVHTSAGSFYGLTFGTATVTAPVQTDIVTTSWLAGGWGVDDTGADAFFYLTLPGNDANNGYYSNSQVQVMIKTDLTVEYHTFIDAYDSTVDIGRQACLYLGNGIHIAAISPSYITGEIGTDVAPNKAGGIYIVHAAPVSAAQSSDLSAFNNEVNPVYGWSGAAWVLNNPNGKPTHALAEEVVDGITVSFNDNAGADTFVSGDFFTTILFDGLIADRSTSYDQRLDTYRKPTFQATSLEAGVLPGTIRRPGWLKKFEPQNIGDWVDANLFTAGVGSLTQSGGDLYGTYSKGIRSAAPAILGNNSNLSGIMRLAKNDETGVQGYVEWNAWTSVTQSIQVIAGLSPASVLGTGFNRNTINYAIEVDHPTADAGGEVTLKVVESGVTQAIFYNFDLTDSTYGKFRIIILTDGSVLYEANGYGTGWITLHRSPPATATIENLHFDVAASSYDRGMRYMKFYSMLPSEDHYLYFGNGSTEGLFDPLFRLVDPDKVEVLIDGVPGVQIAVNDTDTVLAAGEYSVFPEGGVFRYSASDVGKTVSASYLYVKDEF